jgi:endopolyphosphatase
MTLIDAVFKQFHDEDLINDIDFIIWTGDSARHDSDDNIPRLPAQILRTNKRMAQKFLDLATDPLDDMLKIPIIPTWGNNDILPHNIMMPGPNYWTQEYARLWHRFIPEEQAHSFEYLGSFYTEVIPNKLAVFSLNTLYFFDRNAAVDGCARPSEPGYKLLEWLSIKLQIMRARGVKAIVMGHVPPARVESKQLWDETCWQKYTLWMHQYRDVVVSGIFGHMNVDHFLLHDTNELNYNLLDIETVPDEPERDTLPDKFSVESATDYFVEMREMWARIEKKDGMFVSASSVDGDGVDELKGGKKKKGHGKKPQKPNKPRTPQSKYGEDWVLSIVGPSVVPNYQPTYRIVHYNISGLEDTPTWKDSPHTHSVEASGGKKDKVRGPKKDPNLHIPPPPAKKTPPGPAYVMQPLSLLRIQQYFANLTYINRESQHAELPLEETARKDDEEADSHYETPVFGPDIKKPPRHNPHETHPFKFELEYDSSLDEIMQMPDMLVNSYLNYAYRMGQKVAKKHDKSPPDNEEPLHDELDFADDGEVDADGKKKKKKKKGRKDKMHNEVWLHFLRHAFVKTVGRDDLLKLEKR